MKRLEAKNQQKYSVKNVVLSGTHTHSGPGGYLQYVLLIVTSKGWVQQSFDAIVDGIVEVKLHNGMAICVQLHSQFSTVSIYMKEHHSS